MNNKHERIRKIALTAILSAIIVVLGFTIGYIKLGPVQVTLIVAPVAIGAILLGPWYGAFLGGVFGLTSFLQALLGLDPAFGTILIGYNLFATIILCFVPRILMGLLTGLIFKGLVKVFKKDIYAHIISCVCAALLNTILFMTALIIFFYSSPLIQGFVESKGITNIIGFVIAFVGLNGIIEIAVNFIVGSAISKSLYVIYKR